MAYTVESKEIALFLRFEVRIVSSSVVGKSTQERIAYVVALATVVGMVEQIVEVEPPIKCCPFEAVGIATGSC